MICPFCKEEILDGAIKCKHCSSMISDVKNVSVAPASAPPPTSTPSPVITDEDYNSFIGKNAAKYIIKFKSFQAGGFDSFKVTWHWPAFFVPFIWLLYRKLYLWALLIFCLSIIPYVGFIVMIVMGITANYLYYKDAKKKILALNSLHKTSESQGSDEIAHAGGVNNVAVWIGAILFIIVIIGVLAAIALPQFTAYKNRGYCALAKSELKQAHVAALALYIDKPNANISGIQQLEAFGLKPTKGVNFEILRGDFDNLIISSKHSGCDDTYFVNTAGEISINIAPAATPAVTPAAPAVTPAAPAVIPAAPAVQQKQSSSVEQSGICKGLDLSITAEQIECLDRKYTTADKELNNIYKQTMSKLEASRKSALKKEQIAWIKEKETKCAKAGKEMEGGTLETVMIKDCFVQMTEQRIAYLKTFK